MLFLGCLIISLQGTAQPLSEKINEQITAWGVKKDWKRYYTYNSERLIQVWDSLYPAHRHTIFNLMEEQEWESLFTFLYSRALAEKDSNIQFKLAFPLATIYHTESKFKEGLPLFELLYAGKEKLDSVKYPLVLIKLEEEYRSLNKMDAVVRLRSERVDNGFIKTFWEIYKDCGLYQEAINDFLLFEELPEELHVGKLKYYWNLGDLHFKNGALDSAFHYFQAGLKEAEAFYLKSLSTKEITEENARFWPGLFNGLMGKCLVQRGHWAQALPYLEKDIASCRGRYRISSWLYLSDCLINQNQPKESKKILDSLGAYLTGKSMKEATVHFFKNMASYFNQTGRFDSAYKYLELYTKEQGAESRQLSANQAAFLISKMELQERRNEIDLMRRSLQTEKSTSLLQKKANWFLGISLGAAMIILILLYKNNISNKRSSQLIEERNSKLEEYAQEIAKQATTNNVLLQELHHRVKNNLQLMHSLINLQVRRTRQQETKDILKTISGRIHSMSLVHEKLHSRTTGIEIEMNAYIHSLVTHIERAFASPTQNTVITCAIEPVKMHPAQAGSIGLIINEVVSNSFKHAFKNEQEGRISIVLIRTEKGSFLEISDNGPGFNKAAMPNDSLGMKLIQSISNQLQATHHLQSENGVIHSFTFKG